MFDDTRLPENIESGAQGGPSFNTTIQTYGSGREKRNANWSQQRMVYDVAYGIQDAADYAAVVAFYYARLGRWAGFRFKDWSDFSAAGQIIGQGDGETKTFQLTKTYVDNVRSYTRTITRPVAGTVQVYASGVLVGIVADNQPGGVVTLAAAPGAGPIAASFEFDVPVRFDIDELQLDLPTELVATISGIKLIELIE